MNQLMPAEEECVIGHCGVPSFIYYLENLYEIFQYKEMSDNVPSLIIHRWLRHFSVCCVLVLRGRFDFSLLGIRSRTFLRLLTEN